MKNIYILFIIILFTNCTKQDITSDRVEFSLSAGVSSKTRGATSETPSRFKYEVWKLDNTVEGGRICVKRDVKTVTENTEMGFSLRLIPGIYNFYIWADYGETFYYIDDFSQIKIQENYEGSNSQRDAFRYKLENYEISKTAKISAELTRPLMKMSLFNTSETSDYSNTNVAIIYTDGFYDTYNLYTEEVSNSGNSINPTYPNPTSTKLLLFDYLFVKPNSGYISCDVTTQKGNDETSKKTTNIIAAETCVNKELKIRANFNN